MSWWWSNFFLPYFPVPASLWYPCEERAFGQQKQLNLLLFEGFVGFLTGQEDGEGIDHHHWKPREKDALRLQLWKDISSAGSPLPSFPRSTMEGVSKPWLAGTSAVARLLSPFYLSVPSSLVQRRYDRCRGMLLGFWFVSPSTIHGPLLSSPVGYEYRWSYSIMKSPLYAQCSSGGKWIDVTS